MDAVAGCFVLSTIFLSCGINPLQIGSYPDVELVAFPIYGKTTPETLSYKYEDWSNLKIVSMGQKKYTCERGRCLLDMHKQPATFAPSTSEGPKNEEHYMDFKSNESTTVSPVISPSEGPQSVMLSAITPTTLKESKGENGQDSMKFQSTNPLKAIQRRGHENQASNPIRNSSQGSNSTQKPTQGLISNILVNNTGNKTNIWKILQNHLKKIRKSFEKEFFHDVKDIKESLKEGFKKELKEQFKAIKELIIGFSSTVISIPVLGGSVIIAIKLYQKRHRTMNIPEHLYLPLHTPPTLTSQPQIDTDEDEDDEVFDMRNLRCLTPSAPLKVRTPQSDHRETKVKQILSTIQPQSEAQASSFRHHRSRSEDGILEGCSPISLNYYNLRSRDVEIKKGLKSKKKIEITEL